MSKEHGREMYEKDDEEHIKRMEEMTELMNDPEAMKDWMEKKKKNLMSFPTRIRNNLIRLYIWLLF